MWKKRDEKLLSHLYANTSGSGSKPVLTVKQPAGVSKLDFLKCRILTTTRPLDLHLQLFPVIRPHWNSGGSPEVQGCGFQIILSIL